MIKNEQAAEEALRLLIDTIRATGGVVPVGDGLHAPAGDEDWIDLAEAYFAACEAMGEEPEARDING